MMTPIIFYNLVMAIIGSMQTFTQSYIMTDGGPSNASLFYSLLVYRTAFKQSKMGYSAAMSWVLFVIIAALTGLVFKTSNKWVIYENGDWLMKKIKRARCIAYILLILISIAMLFPFFWMVRSAFMTNREIMTTPIQWLPSHYDLEKFQKSIWTGTIWKILYKFGDYCID